MKVLSNDGLEKLIQLSKNEFVSKTGAVQVGEASTVQASTVSLAAVATSGSYDDLTDTSNVQTKTNLVTSVSSSSTDTQYPSAKLFYDTVGDIETLINAL